MKSLGDQVCFPVRDPIDKSRLKEFLGQLASVCNGPGRVYVTGGATAVLYGWRDSTIDIDLKFFPEPAGVFGEIPGLKNKLNVNVELAAPSDFVPALNGWESRSEWINESNNVSFYHFDFYTQALSKIERDHTKDRIDVNAMIERKLIEPSRLLQLFNEITLDQWGRYPALEPEEIAGKLKVLLDG